MESYRTEEEQVEALKRWWQENGRGTLIAIAFALAVSFGWQSWQASRAEAAQNASLTYQQLLQALVESEEQGSGPVEALAKRIKDQYPGSSYAEFAALHLARIAVESGDLAAAEQELRWVIGRADGQLKAVTQQRLARVLAARGDTEQALTLLAEGESGPLSASYAIARGEVLLGAGREAEALAAFEAAAAALDPSLPLPRDLQDKIDFLSVPDVAKAADGSVEAG